VTTAVRIGEEPLGEVVAALGGEDPTPAAGTALAATVALAAGLVAKCARKAVGRIDDAEALLARAQGWQGRALALADEDAAGFRAVLDARRRGAGDEALARAADPPLAIAELGAEVASAAADMAGRGKPWLRSDGYAAALLAESATRAAARLATSDLAAAGVDDERGVRARQFTVAAAASRTRAEAATEGGHR
jgi:methenyltetrahydrofolate cyclohydrolase